MADTFDTSFPPGYEPLLFTEASITLDQFEATANQAKNSIEQRRNVLKKHVPQILSVKQFAAVTTELALYDERHTDAVRAFEKQLPVKDKPLMVSVLKEMEWRLLQFEQRTEAQVLAGPWGIATSQAIDILTTRLSDQLAAKFSEQLDRLQEGTKQLLALKTTREAAGTFEKHVNQLATETSKRSRNWLIALVATWAVSLAVECVVLFAVVGSSKPTVYGMVGAITAGIAFVLYFMNGQYRVAKIMAIKYEHMKGLAGGGAESLIGLLGEHPEFRKEILERLASSFMTLDDITGAVSKLRTPAEDAVRLIEATAKVAAEVRKPA